MCGSKKRSRCLPHVSLVIDLPAETAVSAAHFLSTSARYQPTTGSGFTSRPSPISECGLSTPPRPFDGWSPAYPGLGSSTSSTHLLNPTPCSVLGDFAILLAHFLAQRFEVDHVEYLGHRLFLVIVSQVICPDSVRLDTVPGVGPLRQPVAEVSGGVTVVTECADRFRRKSAVRTAAVSHDLALAW